MNRVDRLLPQSAPNGRPLLIANLGGTALFAVAAVASLLLPDLLRIPFAVVSSALFVVGCVAFVWAYAVSIGRSRSEQISVAGIYGLSGSAPAGTRRWFHGVTLVQVVIAVISASLAPFTAQAFGILVPMLGVGLGGLWAAKFGVFHRRVTSRGRRLTTTKESEVHG